MRRCDEVGALLIFDEVQCGMGRTGHPFAANLYGVTPDMITTAKALGNGFPCAALLMSPHVAAAVKLESLGTTFGGGPMACAVIEAVIDAIEREDLLRAGAARRGVHPQDVHRRARGGPPGCGFPHRACARRVPLKKFSRRCSSARFSRAPAGDPQVLRLLPPYVLDESHVDLLRAALAALPAMKRFVDLADFERDECSICSTLSRRLETQPEPQRARRQRSSAWCSSIRRLRTLASFQAGMARLGGSSFVITPGQGTWQLETRRGVSMSGAAAEHVREGIPVLASYCDALGIRAFADGQNLRARSRRSAFSAMASLVDKPLVNLESAMNHPCQALADWKTLDDIGVPATANSCCRGSIIRGALPLAVPAATVHMAAMRGMEVVVLRPEGFALPHRDHG